MSMPVADRPKRIAEHLVALKKLAQAATSPEAFVAEWLPRVVAMTDATGGRLRRPIAAGELAVVAELRFGETARDEQEPETAGGEVTLYAKLVLETYSTTRPKVVPPREQLGEEADANPSDGALLLSPLVIGDETRGVVELVLPQTPPPRELDAMLKLIEQATASFAEFERRRRERGLQARQQLVDEVERFTRAVHDTLSVRSVAYTAANDGRRLIGCDRVAVLIRRGGAYRVEAVSGLEVVETRSQAAKLLGALAETAVRTGQAITFHGAADDLSPQVRTALAKYVDEAHVRAVAVYPLVAGDEESNRSQPGKPLGALVVEQIEDIAPVAGREERAQLVAAHTAKALANALDHESIPLLPLWRRTRELRKLFTAGTRNKTLTVLGVVMAALLTLKFVPADFALHAKATLQPTARQHVFAPLDGTVHKIHVRHGDHVTAGQLLLELRNTDLDVALADVVGQRTASAEQLLSVERALFEDASKISIEERHRLSGQRSELKQKLAALDEQLRLLRRKRDLLKVVSPIAGEVTTWNVEQLLEHRPVRQGQVLIDVADAGGAWELELQVPEHGIAHLLRAQQEHALELPVTYRLAADPEHDRSAAVREVHYAAEVRGEEGNTILVRAALAAGDLPPLRPGAEATAKIYCGRRSLGYVWLHDAVDFVHAKILFRTY